MENKTFEKTIQQEAELRSLIKVNRDYFIAGSNFAHSINSKRVKELEEALENIMKMKLLPNESDYKYAYNRCWHIADKALNQTP